MNPINEIVMRDVAVKKITDSGYLLFTCGLDLWMFAPRLIPSGNKKIDDYKKINQNLEEETNSIPLQI
jgi:hypothetical protein